MLSLLLLAAIAESAPIAENSAAAPRPLEQRLELQLDPGARAWSGSLLTTLEVRAATRRVRFRLEGPVVSRVEMADRDGRVKLAWGLDAEGMLLVETNRPLVPGTARLDVAFDGEWRAAAPGLARDSSRTRVTLEQGSAIAFPAWPETIATPWTVRVHAPRACVVRASGRRTGLTESRGWRTWTFRTGRAVPGDSLRAVVRRARR